MKKVLIHLYMSLIIYAQITSAMIHEENDNISHHIQIESIQKNLLKDNEFINQALTINLKGEDLLIEENFNRDNADIDLSGDDSNIPYLNNEFIKNFLNVISSQQANYVNDTISLFHELNNFWNENEYELQIGAQHYQGYKNMGFNPRFKDGFDQEAIAKYKKFVKYNKDFLELIKKIQPFHLRNIPIDVVHLISKNFLENETNLYIKLLKWNNDDKKEFTQSFVNFYKGIIDKVNANENIKPYYNTIKLLRLNQSDLFAQENYYENNHTPLYNLINIDKKAIEIAYDKKMNPPFYKKHWLFVSSLIMAGLGIAAYNYYPGIISYVWNTSIDSVK